MKCVRIGNGCGFWGDNLDAPVALAERGRLDYLTLEYLAELTMSILAQQKARNPDAGYAHDFLDVLERLGPALKAQPHLKIVTNAGGMNPPACAARAREVLGRAGLRDRAVAVVRGDDLLPRLDELLACGHLLAHLDTGEPLRAVRDRVVSANAYLGSPPIAEALARGAAVVITGRVADAALTLGPAAHEFNWRWDDWDRLAAGTVAGHLIECGAQATGGLWCNWQEADDLAGAGYPVAEVEPDGTFRLTKPPHTGGAVNRETVAEQLLYEVGDPAAYLTPDVTADFTSVTLTETGPDVVTVRHARGRPAPDSYKVSAAYRDGYAASGTLVIAGPDAAHKARRCGEMVLERLRRAGAAPRHSHAECLGAGELAFGRAEGRCDAPEVVLRVAVRDPSRAVVERFSKELAPLVTSGPPGVTGYTTGRPAVREVFAYWPALIPRSAVVPEVELFR
jgi:hypothetical protein